MINKILEHYFLNTSARLLDERALSYNLNITKKILCVYVCARDSDGSILTKFCIQVLGAKERF